MYSCYPSGFVETPSYETPSLLPLGYCYALATDCIHVFYLPIYYVFCCTLAENFRLPN